LTLADAERKMRLSINTTHGFNMTNKQHNDRAEQRATERKRDAERQAARRFITSTRRESALRGRGALL
jgi:hypothetical protein